MVGHGKPINHVIFSPDGRYIASGSFDKKVKLWDGYTGEFMCNFDGHVGPVYLLCWSVDSRYIISGSQDSTLKLWDLKTRKLMMDLPGHADQVYALDWDIDGRLVASGGKDRQVKLWCNWLLFTYIHTLKVCSNIFTPFDWDSFVSCHRIGICDLSSCVFWLDWPRRRQLIRWNWMVRVRHS